MRTSLLPAVIPMLTVLLLSCSTSKQEATTDMGTISGYVEQIFHHGAYDPDGPNKTVSRIANVVLYVTDQSAILIDSMRTNSAGEFIGVFPIGTYTVSVPEQEEEDIPGSSPAPETVMISKGDTVQLSFQYRIYAP